MSNELPPEALHVWRACVDQGPLSKMDILSEQERERAKRFLRREDRERWLSTRVILRLLCGRYLQSEPGDVGFAMEATGKPMLVAAGAIRFNLSHCRDVALIAFARGIEVGVDVELAGAERNTVALVRRMFGAGEAERLERLDPVAREHEFLRLWTRHEAALKCTGEGIGGTVRQDSLWIADIDVGPEGAGAVAAAVAPQEWELFSWP